MLVRSVDPFAVTSSATSDHRFPKYFNLLAEVVVTQSVTDERLRGRDIHKYLSSHQKKNSIRARVLYWRRTKNVEYFVDVRWKNAR